MINPRNSKVVAIAQLRMGSTRLPGKIMMKFNNGMTMLDVLMARLKAATKVEEIVFAYPWGDINDQLNRPILDAGLFTFRGSEDDVLDRFFRASVVRRGQIIVRVCGDNPLTDPRVIDRCVDVFKQKGVDYLVPEGLPLGTFVEVTTIDAIEKAWNESTDPADREHVTSYIRNNPNKFSQYRLKWEPAQWIFPRVTVDTESDFQLVNTLISRFKDPVELRLENLKR